MVEEQKIVKKVLKIKKAIGNAGGQEVIDAAINEAKPLNFKICLSKNLTWVVLMNDLELDWNALLLFSTFITWVFHFNDE